MWIKIHSLPVGMTGRRKSLSQWASKRTMSATLLTSGYRLTGLISSAPYSPSAQLNSPTHALPTPRHGAVPWQPFDSPPTHSNSQLPSVFLSWRLEERESERRKFDSHQPPMLSMLSSSWLQIESTMALREVGEKINLCLFCFFLKRYLVLFVLTVSQSYVKLKCISLTNALNDTSTVIIEKIW